MACPEGRPAGLGDGARCRLGTALRTALRYQTLIRESPDSKPSVGDDRTWIGRYAARWAICDV